MSEPQALAGPNSQSSRPVALATAGATIATLSLYTISAYADPIAQRFALSSLEVGALSSGLAASYALMQVPAGLFGVRFGARSGFSLGLVLVGIGFCGSATIVGFVLLMCFRVVAGAGAGC